MKNSQVTGNDKRISKACLPLGFVPVSGTNYEPNLNLPIEIVGEVDQREMILIPGGEFLMGTSQEQVDHILSIFNVEVELSMEEVMLGLTSLKAEYFQDEMPQHPVWVDTFYIDKYEVTNKAYAHFCTTTGHSGPQYWETYPEDRKNKHAVKNISWEDACIYAKWSGKRLPTEAEWEKAARGTDGRWFPWGNEFDRHRVNFWRPFDLEDLHNRRIEAENITPSDIESYLDGATPQEKLDMLDNVDAYPEGASPYGVMDMLGNVAEWVYDWYDAEYYSKSLYHNPKGPETGITRVHKSCHLSQNRERLHCAFRNSSEPTDRAAFGIGFRCALSLVIESAN